MPGFASVTDWRRELASPANQHGVFRSLGLVEDMLKAMDEMQ